MLFRNDGLSHEILLGFQTSPSTFPFLFFSFFFVNFDFSYFFVFLKASNINVNSTRKISDHKIYALKVERVPNTFENFNSFEMTLKMLKTMQIYQKCIFRGFLCFFAIFWFFCKFIKNTGQKLGSNNFNKLVIKVKMHDKYFLNFSLLYEDTI
jgi:hypothetical protein